jgi:TolB-like protein/DNA-binding winged helix-turn-helix (wHTH) protein/Tfp pilus assembly protein PilF
MEPRCTPLVRFGTCEFDVRSRELRKNGVRIKIQPQPMKVLEILLERPGEMIPREALRTRIWPNESFGAFDQAVNVAVTKLRAALGDSAENPRYIETLPKRGYRFIAPLATVGSVAEGHPESTPAKVSIVIDDTSGNRRRVMIGPGLVLWSRGWRLVAIALVICVSAFAVWVFEWHSGKTSNIRSLAVLPLDNLSRDASQDYFADGMTDQLITDLAQISALRVISRTSAMSYKHARKPLPEIARELNVEAVIEGTVLRSGGKVRITAQLIAAPADQHLWAKSYEGKASDTLALQQRVADDIAEQIRIELTPQERANLKDVKRVNPEAYEDYLKGRYFWNKRTADGFKKAVDYFNQAIAKDPNYAPAYAGLADAYVVLGAWQYGVLDPQKAYQLAEAAANKALELDNALGEAHISLAMATDMYAWDWKASEREFKRGLELSPGYATGHQWYGEHLNETARSSEAIAEFRKAESMDPLSLSISSELATHLVIARRYDEAIEQARKAIEMDPRFAVAHFALGMAYEQKQMYKGAIVAFQKAVEFSGGNPGFKANLAHAYAVVGRKNEAVSILKELKGGSNHEFVDPSQIALIYVGLNEKDQAMIWLEKAFEDHFDAIILTWPAFDPMRSDPRFQDLVRRIGLPQ